MRLSAARSAFFRPKARAISRVPTLPGCLPMKARMSSLEGRGGVVRFTIKSARKSRLCRNIGTAGRFRQHRAVGLVSRPWRSWPCGRASSPRRQQARASPPPTASASCARCCAAVREPWPRHPWRPSAPSCRRRPGSARIDQAERLFERDGFRRHVGRQRGVDAVVADIGAVAAVLDHDRAALVGMIAERPARDRRRSGPCAGPWPSSRRSASPRG